jgi:hypothetical protein
MLTNDTHRAQEAGISGKAVEEKMWWGAGTVVLALFAKFSFKSEFSNHIRCSYVKMFKAVKSGTRVT